MIEALSTSFRQRQSTSKSSMCTQLPDTQIPTFVFYANLPQYVKEPYKRFLENKIRENWTLTGSPINVFIRQK